MKHAFLFLLVMATTLANAVADDGARLKATYLEILKPYGADEALLDRCWEEVVEAYTGPRRHYHNLEHLANFERHLHSCKDSLEDFETAYLAMIYHDVVYFTTDGTNEDQSAAFADRHLALLGYPADKVARCHALIMATKTHAGSTDSDTNYFVDADMAILGADPAAYQRYVANIRQEYGASPQFDRGRQRVLQHFLDMDRLFKTDLFFDRFEKQARKNIAAEIRSLQAN